MSIYDIKKPEVPHSKIIRGVFLGCVLLLLINIIGGRQWNLWVWIIIYVAFIISQIYKGYYAVKQHCTAYTWYLIAGVVIVTLVIYLLMSKPIFYD